ncbi:hypothetical protein B4098_1735 [Heyndrickxia coagulans]|uniref:Uncharacterized protein n=1 Tax=Heyndrickxia coagulans TaxID=1398 RepID=A0A150JTV0_HEYCO|nr:hypothetical protein B4098_1735 [Heyndrickxia coagulans]
MVTLNPAKICPILHFLFIIGAIGTILTLEYGKRFHIQHKGAKTCQDHL